MKNKVKILKEQKTVQPVNAPKDELDSLMILQSELPGLKGYSVIENLGPGGAAAPTRYDIGGKLYTAGIRFKSKTNKDYWVLYDGKIVLASADGYEPYVKDGRQMYYDNYQNYVKSQNLTNAYQKTLEKFGLTNVKNLYQKLGNLQKYLNTVTQKGAQGQVLVEFNNLLTYFYPNDTTKRLTNAQNAEIQPTDMDERNLTQNYDKCNLNRYGINISDDEGNFFIPKDTTCGLVKTTFNLDKNECKTDLIEFFKLYLYRNASYDEDNIRDTRKRVQRCKTGGQYENVFLKSSDFGELDVESKDNPFRDPSKQIDFCEIADIVSQDPTQNVIFNLTPYRCDSKTKRENRRQVRKMGRQTESLDRLIKKTLMETKENKTKLIQENKIIKTRFDIILESANIKKQDEVYKNILSEMIYLERQGFDKKVISENVMGVFGVLSNLFGRSTNSIMDTFKERGVEWILGNIGIKNGYLKNYLSTALGNVNIIEVPKLFTDCDFLTKKIAETIPEAYLRKLEERRGSGGMFTDVVRNALYDVIRESNFSQKIEASIASLVCPVVDKLSGVFSDKLTGMKGKLIEI